MTSFFTKLCVFCLCLIFPIKNIYGTEIYFQDKNDNLLRTQWTTDEGLPQNTVNKIIQTHDGYIWLATWGGLARFDGIRFTIFNSANTPVIKNNRIVSLAEDINGNLWLSTEGFEFIRFKDGIYTS